jgi:YHS domain-containing protein
MKRLISTGLLAALAFGCGKSETKPIAPPPAPAKPADTHDHLTVGPHGGPLAEWGDHAYHVEFTVDAATGTATAYVLDKNAKVAVPISAKDVSLSLKATVPVTIALSPKPQPGDPAGLASAYSGTHESLRTMKRWGGTLAAQFDGKRYAAPFETPAHKDHVDVSPPAGAPTAREIDLFLKPGGIYTLADIEKNGGVVPAVKFAGVAFDHDDDLKPGDKICPVTVNKADEKCVWWVNGQQYTFCCPPCLEKFVKQAKTTPEKVKAPGEYIQK